jgi:hypothetical protein
MYILMLIKFINGAIILRSPELSEVRTKRDVPHSPPERRPRNSLPVPRKLERSLVKYYYSRVILSYHQSSSISKSLVDYYSTVRVQKQVLDNIRYVSLAIDVYSYLFWGEANKTLCYVVVGGGRQVVSDPRSAADLSFYTVGPFF